MAGKPGFDQQLAHKYYSAECFNRAWDYIDKTERNENEQDSMLQLSLASLWHWMQRKDVTATDLSIGYWQVSRVFALLKQAELARRYGEFSLKAAQGPDVEPFVLGYAYESLARAEMVAGDVESMEKYLIQARQIVSALPDDEKKQLSNDLDTIH